VPRNNRDRRRARPQSDEDTGLDRLTSGWARTEIRRGREYRVQPISATAAQKEYLCPGCGRGIEPGVPHVVVWRQDGVLGDAADLASRRHWHLRCWRIG
jgi:hypothetical protein